MRHTHSIVLSVIMLLVSLATAGCDSAAVSECKDRCGNSFAISLLDAPGPARSKCKSFCSKYEGKCPDRNGPSSADSCAVRAVMCLGQGSDCN